MAVCDLKLEEQAVERHTEKIHWQPTDLMALELPHVHISPHLPTKRRLEIAVNKNANTAGI